MEEPRTDLLAPGKELRQSLQGCEGIKFIDGALGRQLTTFAIGGELPCFAEASSVEGLSVLIARTKSFGIPYRVIGGGSNLLIPDLGVADCVIRLGKEFRFSETLAGSDGSFRIGGASSLMSLSREMSVAGYSGLEFAGGIPASIGGAVRMNAGAHGSEMVSILTNINFLDSDGQRRSARPSELSFAYRRSGLPKGAIVTSIEVKLERGDGPKIEERRAHFFSERKKRQPLQYPSAGSIFKNPPSKTAGQVLEECGLKGCAVGGAQVSTLHANWIINPSRTAVACEVLDLISMCKAKVLEQMGVSLEPELVVW